MHGSLGSSNVTELTELSPASAGGGRRPASCASATAGSRSASVGTGAASRDPGRQGAPGVAGLHVREGVATRPYQNGRSERLLRRRCAGGPTARSRTIDWDTAIARWPNGFARVRDATAASRSSTTAAAGRATIWAAPMRRHARRARLRYRSNALAQEKTGEFWVTGKMFGAYMRATSSTARSRSSSARTRGCPTASRTPAPR